MIENKKEKSAFIRFITSEFVVYVFFGILTTLVSWITYAIFQAIIPDITILTGANGTREAALLSLEPSNATIVFADGFIAIKSTVVANVLSWVCAFLFAFFVNKLFVFKSKDWSPKIALNEFWQFFVARFATGFIEWFGQPFLQGLGVDIVVTLPIIGTTEGMISKIITSVIVTILNYIFSKFIIFSKKKKDISLTEAEENFERAQKEIDETLEKISK